MTLPSREEVRSAYRHLDFTKSDKKMFARVLQAYINGELVEKSSLAEEVGRLKKDTSGESIEFINCKNMREAYNRGLDDVLKMIKQ